MPEAVRTDEGKDYTSKHVLGAEPVNDFETVTIAIY